MLGSPSSHGRKPNLCKRKILDFAKTLIPYPNFSLSFSTDRVIAVSFTKARFPSGITPIDRQFATMSTKSPSPILLLFMVITFIIGVTVNATPTSVQFVSEFNRLQSDEHGSTSICPQSVNRGACPIRCFRADPVCGVDNVTYWCGCPEALCAGVSVAKRGYCDTENGGSGQVSGQALLLVHIVWLVLLGFFVLFGLL